MMLRLADANARNRPEQLDEVMDLLRQIKSAWDALPHDVVAQHADGARR